MDPKAILGGTFFHTASVLLFVRVDENRPKSKNLRARVQVICPWILFGHHFARARDINFKLASKLKSELEATIDILVNANHNHKSPK